MKQWTGSVVSVNISERKGEVKKEVPFCIITSDGLEGDAHSGNWHRQVSLLALERIAEFSGKMNKKLDNGAFAENIVTRGINLQLSAPGDEIAIGNDIRLEVTQIGKECHGSRCAIYEETGSCIMPKEGIFCKVITGGKVGPGDTMTLISKKDAE